MSRTDPPTAIPPSIDETNAQSDVWESEGGGLSHSSTPESLGIVRQMTETYLVGGFRYTKLSDAVAQARRMVKLERELM